VHPCSLALLLGPSSATDECIADNVKYEW